MTRRSCLPGRFAPALASLTALLITTATLIGCRDSTAPGPEAGEYALVTMNDQPLPITVTDADPPSTRVFQSATLRLTSGGPGADSYRLMIRGTRDGAVRVLFDDSGEYDLAGEKINFISKVDPTRSYAGTLDTGAVLVSLPPLALKLNAGIVFLYFEK